MGGCAFGDGGCAVLSCSNDVMLLRDASAVNQKTGKSEKIGVAAMTRCATLIAFFMSLCTPSKLTMPARHRDGRGDVP